MRNLAFRQAMIVIAASGGLSAQPAITAVLNGASFNAAVSPGSWITILGNNLAAAPVSSSSLPTTLGGVSVSVGGQTAPLSYVSPNHVNALIPFETVIPANTVVPLVLTNAGTGATYNIRLTRNAPGIFTLNGAGTGGAIISNPEGLADVIGGYDYIFYATGLGPVDALGHLTDSFDVYLTENKAQVSSVEQIPDLPGVYRIQVTAPLFPATDRLYLSSGGWQSNIVDVPIRAISNAINVTGTIDGLYPSSDPYFTLPPCTTDDENAPPCAPGQDLSLMLHAGTFSVAYDSGPPSSEAPFHTIAAVGEAGGVVITVDETGTYSASIVVPAMATQSGDFSNSGVALWDYSSCGSTSAVCMPFLENHVPANRLSPWWLQATQSLPAPNVSSSGLNGIFRAPVSVTGSHFVIDAENNAGLSKFGGFVQVPYGPFDKRVSMFKLYVDGKLVATKDVPYTVVHR